MERESELTFFLERPLASNGQPAQQKDSRFKSVVCQYSPEVFKLRKRTDRF